MAILRRGSVSAKAKELENFYKQLTAVLEGQGVDLDQARYYVSREEEAKNLVEINIDKLLDAVGHFKVSLESLRRLNSSAMKPSSNPLFYSGEPPPF